MGRTIHVVRHGEVENPEKILYGRQSGWHLSERGKAMAEVVADWSKQFDIGAIHASPLERAQETAAPISKIHGIEIETDSKLIEAENKFEGKKFELGNGVLWHPRSWWHLRNPWRPSWGEPYIEQVNRMLAAVFYARDKAGGKDALVVSHQLPIWMLRSAIENRNLIHDPRKRICTLASVTSLHLDDHGDIESVSYTEPAKHLLPNK